MALPWLFYALFAPLMFGIVNLLDKFLTRRFSYVTLNVLSGLSTGVALLALPFVGLNLPTGIILLCFFAGALWFLAGFPYFKAIQIEEVSRVVPLWQLAVPMTVVFSLVFLGERLSSTSYAALALIFCGAFLVSVKDLKNTLRLTPAFWLMVAAAAFVTSASLITKWLYSSAGFWQVQVLLLIGNFIAAAVAFAFFGKLRKGCLGDLKKARPGLKSVLLSRLVVEIVGYVAFNVAILTGSVSLTMVLDGLTGFFVFAVATIISVWWPALFREELSRKALLMKAAAIVMIFAGLVLVQVIS